MFYPQIQNNHDWRPDYKPILITASSDNIRGEMINTKAKNCIPDSVTQTLILKVSSALSS